MKLITKVVLISLCLWVTCASVAVTLGRILPGQALYFIASLDGKFKIYAMDLPRYLTHKLNDQEARADPLALSPDGQQLLFVAKTGNLTYAPYIMDWKGANAHPLPAENARQITWSPDGKAVVYWSAYDQHIYVMDTGGASQQKLTQGFTDQRSPVWSPDGKQIAYVSTRGGWSRLYAMNADGTNIRCLTNHPVYINGLGTLDWSPDAELLAAVGDDRGRLAIFVLQPEVVNADDPCGSHERRVDLGNMNVYSLAWSPDGQQIAYSSNTGGDWAIYVVNTTCFSNPEGCATSQRRLSPARMNASQHAWSPDGGYVIYTVGLNRSPQIWMASIDGEQRPISDSRFSYWSPIWWPG